MVKRRPARGFRTVSEPVDRVVHAGFAAACGNTAAANLRPNTPFRVWPNETWREYVAGAWTIAYRVALRRGALVVSEIRIFPTEDLPWRRAGEWSAAVLGDDARVPHGGVPAHVHRRISTRKALRTALDVLEDWRAELDRFFDGAQGQREGLVATLPERPTRGRRAPRVSDKELRRVATAIRKAKDPTRRAIEAARALKMDTPKGRARVRYLALLARERGFLPRIERE